MSKEEDVQDVVENSSVYELRGEVDTMTVAISNNFEFIHNFLYKLIDRLDKSETTERVALQILAMSDNFSAELGDILEDLHSDKISMAEAIKEMEESKALYDRFIEDGDYI